MCIRVEHSMNLCESVTLVVVLKFVSGRILLFLKLKWEAHLDTLVDWLLTASSSARSWQQAQELISGLCLGARARFLPFNRTQSRAVRQCTV